MELAYLKFNGTISYIHIWRSQKTSRLLLLFRPSKMPSRARHRHIIDIVQFVMKHFMYVTRDHILHPRILRAS